MNSITLQTGELYERSNNRTTCLYCAGKLPSKMKEHVFGSAFGGRHKSSRLICDNCNSYFAKNIDSAFSTYSNWIMNVWMFKGERHKDIPIIKLDCDYILQAGAIPKLKDDSISLTYLGETNGTKEYKFTCDSISHLKYYIYSGEFEKKIGKTFSSSDKDTIIKNLKFEKHLINIQNKAKLEGNLDPNSEYRLAGHTILKCIAMFMPEVAESDDLKNLKSFIRYGKGDWDEFAIDVKETISPQFKTKEPYLNSVTIYFSKQHGMVVGTLNLLNKVQFSIVLEKCPIIKDIFFFVGDSVNKNQKLKTSYAELPIDFHQIPFFDVINTKLTIDDLLLRLQKLNTQIFRDDRVFLHSYLQ